MSDEIESNCKVHPQREAEKGINGGFPHLHCQGCQDSLLSTIEQLQALLKISHCPNENCLDGSIPHQISEKDWEAEQCQFCFEKGRLIPALPTQDLKRWKRVYRDPNPPYTGG